MAHTLKECFDTNSMKWFGKPYNEVDKLEFVKKWSDDFQERHKHWTEEDWKEYENR